MGNVRRNGKPRIVNVNVTAEGDSFIIEVAQAEREHLDQWYKGFLQGAGVHPDLWHAESDGTITNLNIDKSDYSDEQIILSGQRVYQTLTRKCDYTEKQAVSYLEGFFDGIQFSKDTKHK